MTPREMAEIRTKADTHPADVAAQVAAAYACDRWGRETDAIVYYDAAWRLGGPAHDMRDFLVGYGSTLRNVGRVAESLALLDAAVERYPRDQALRAFQGLALHSAGRHAEAMAAVIDALLLSPSPDAARFGRALAFYRDELRSRQKE